MPQDRTAVPVFPGQPPEPRAFRGGLLVPRGSSLKALTGRPERQVLGTLISGDTGRGDAQVVTRSGRAALTRQEALGAREGPPREHRGRRALGRRRGAPRPQDGSDGTPLTCFTAALKAPRMAAAPPQSLFIPGMVVYGWHKRTGQGKWVLVAGHSAPPAPPPWAPQGPRGSPDLQGLVPQNPGDSHCHRAAFQKHQEVMTEVQGTLPIEQSFGGDPRGPCQVGGGGRRVRRPGLLSSLGRGAAQTQLPWLGGQAVTLSQATRGPGHSPSH